MTSQPRRLFAIGDIQGCYDEFQRLLERIGFDPDSDHVWLTGDLINRGPKSLAVLNFVRALPDSFSTVLGNHDLHLLAVWAGTRKPSKRDTLDQIVAHPEAPAIIDWLRDQPLLTERHCDDRHYVLVHAGIYPQWPLEKARHCAREVETALRSPHWQDFVANMYGDCPDCWSESLSGWPRLRFITNAFTRMRMLKDGRLDLKAKGGPEDHPNLLPWFLATPQKSHSYTTVFGHWSTLGYLHDHGVIALDTGCLWGGALTAVRLWPGSITLAQVASDGRNKGGRSSA